MIAANIISKDLFRSYLQETFVNREDVLNLLKIFKLIPDHTLHEKLSYLLYNEYIAYNDISFDSNLSDEANITNIINIINKYTEIVNVPYKNMKQYFVRDYIITLDSINYKSKKNINDQLAIIYETFEQEEKDFLTKYGISALIELVRIRESKTQFVHAEVEKNPKLTILSSAINADNHVMVSIFKKITLGTIH